ncbi:hypothetical protein like AT2G23540 [Hibiscus trionum]|uniref:Uncharacterized protein n=1 Tax=Hibiscus trionum TaxID=183268 RepID=A0A9W7JGP4_HIBTR|nr:hypothetical protein like AT2G23540 [Hibiscus trionum]
MGIISKKLMIHCLIYQVLVIHLWSPTICFAYNITAFFVFGDSLAEVGNNYYLDTVAKPEFPNGIDFPRGAPSGRYTNSRITADVIGEELGFKDYTPPYLAPNTSGDVILKGVNYASSGAGILQTTGAIYGERLCLGTQVDYFAKTRQDIISRIGAPAAQALLRKSLYFLQIGSNDIIFGENSFGDVNQYVDDVLSKFKNHLTRLYNLDARKIAVSNAPKLGCMPYEIDTHNLTKGCVESLNEVAKLYNIKLKSMIEDLTNNLTGSIFVYIDGYAVAEDTIKNYRSYGFKNANRACCRVSGRHGGLVPCYSRSRFCPDRTKYVFWDPYHPTEPAVLIGAKLLLDGGLEYVSPINIRQLANS